MKLAATAALASAVSAAPLETRTNDSGAFGKIAIHSGALGIHQQPLTASDHQIFIGKPTVSYCPEGLQPGSCPAGNSTSFIATGSTGALSMNVVVPGGQRVYLDKSGYIGYTIAHSGAIPDGAITDGFDYAPGAEQGQVGELTNSKTKGFTACPTGEDGVYQIKPVFDGLSYVGCTGIALGTIPVAEGSGAWQYS